MLNQDTAVMFTMAISLIMPFQLALTQMLPLSINIGQPLTKPLLPSLLLIIQSLSPFTKPMSAIVNKHRSAPHQATTAIPAAYHPITVALH